jgi:oxygen-independent coproporphyrinogen-3 oxidase
VLGLYVHIPFCAAICNYCNFNRGLFDGKLKDRYLQALLAEIRQAPLAPGPDLPPDSPGTVGADTIFFGGGTPSLLRPDEIGTIIDACRDAHDLSPDAEITLEANPETVSEATLRGFLAAGVNRISFGVQSFDDRELVRLSRLHGADRARAAVLEARAAGCTNVSLDLMICRSTSSSSIPTRRFVRRWPAPNGHKRPTMMPRSCTRRRWIGSSVRGTISTRFRTWPGWGAVPGTT